MLFDWLGYLLSFFLWFPFLFPRLFFFFSFPPPFLSFCWGRCMFSSLVLLLSPLKRSSTFSLSFSFSFSSPFLLLLLLLPLGPFPRCTLSCCDYFKKFSTLATPLPHHTLECFQKEEKGEKEGEVVYLGFSCSSSSVWCLSFLCF